MQCSHVPCPSFCCRSSFEGVGKGWYNLAESNFESYRFSKLRRLMSLVRYGMEDTLRYLAEGSMREFVGFIQVSSVRADWPPHKVLFRQRTRQNLLEIMQFAGHGWQGTGAACQGYLHQLQSRPL